MMDWLKQITAGCLNQDFQAENFLTVSESLSLPIMLLRLNKLVDSSTFVTGDEYWIDKFGVGLNCLNIIISLLVDNIDDGTCLLARTCPLASIDMICEETLNEFETGITNDSMEFMIHQLLPEWLRSVKQKEIFQRRKSDNKFIDVVARRVHQPNVRINTNTRSRYDDPYDTRGPPKKKNRPGPYYRQHRSTPAMVRVPYLLGTAL
jgi:hypothetical protein